MTAGGCGPTKDFIFHTDLQDLKDCYAAKLLRETQHHSVTIFQIRVRYIHRAITLSHTDAKDLKEGHVFC